jgi:CBS domain-containing protein
MTCEQVMTKNPQCCLGSDSAVRAAKIMKIEDVGAVPVCGSRDSRRLIGIITDRDIAIHLVADGRDPHTTKVQDIMTREPFTCRIDEDLEAAIQRMESNQVRRIPVVDQAGMMVGIISQADIALRSHSAEATARVVGEISRPTGAHL